MTSTINPVYLFTGTFSDLLLTPYGTGSFTLDGGNPKIQYWAVANHRVQSGKGGSFRFRSGEVTIHLLAHAYKRIMGNEAEVMRVGEQEDIERAVARLQFEHGRASHWKYLPQSIALVATKGGWEMDAEEMTVLDHIKKPRSLDECLREHLK
ncbi:hypothetical protein NW762_004545 [Fusarium torreyae]|uniref:Uncharacterized protein n=1 Tax=Fusarium torreyae TaxID=1237075 RepID=A0A9W8S6M9_9HYPO|nr:hypothetical protein NW762_004545 [Fusarium torreyae]